MGDILREDCCKIAGGGEGEETAGEDSGCVARGKGEGVGGGGFEVELLLIEGGRPYG